MSSQFSMAELLKATNNFSSDMIIDHGDSFLLYKAQLSNGLTVAVKKHDPEEFPGFREFRAEVETLGKLRHPNIVKLLGYSASDSGGLFVYEYIERGNLHRLLHESNTQLPWKTRLQIVKGVADALAYLHGLDNRIVHRDIKPRNVLLDSEFQPHITNFGLARRIDSEHSHVSTTCAGDIEYMPPEYSQGLDKATLKGDVYSFGILMLEIASGARPSFPVRLANWACIPKMKMIDSSIRRQDLDEVVVKKYISIACSCANKSSRERPPMTQVVELLNQLST
ncbi:putative protein kinase RLK-Pelle-LRR-Xb-1 family [Rosa chinensis]|uniref:non-specific serine/threonine protein kinase n=1 Tax=Rosa chinensis TaxID=74649 RepID=A0A2P6Q951_ROSCH|nr:tyrosine-sulfated glycopeptide receptor 1 [Rosa chinensis]PRQ30703.1 putative protein kinase RLK-Pelle-LRR-Xb-1 family [Rosa chinensis]